MSLTSRGNIQTVFAFSNPPKARRALWREGGRAGPAPCCGWRRYSCLGNRSRGSLKRILYVCLQIQDYHLVYEQCHERKSWHGINLDCSPQKLINSYSIRWNFTELNPIWNAWFSNINQMVPERAKVGSVRAPHSSAKDTRFKSTGILLAGERIGWDGNTQGLRVKHLQILLWFFFFYFKKEHIRYLQKEPQTSHGQWDTVSALSQQPAIQGPVLHQEDGALPRAFPKVFSGTTIMTLHTKPHRLYDEEIPIRAGKCQFGEKQA